MATFCACSAKLALPTLLRNVYRSEFASELHSFQSPHALVSLRRTPYSHHGHHNGRGFTSFSRVSVSQPGSSVTSRQFSQSTITESKSTQLHAGTEDGSIGEALDKNVAAPADSRHPTVPEIETNPAPSKAKSDAGSTRSSRGKKYVQDGQAQKPKPKKKKEHWQIQKEALKKKFEGGWNPSKKLSPDAIEGIRHLHAAAPDRFTTPVLAEQFQISPEAIRRILKSKWRPSEHEMEDRRKRWEKRHDRIWSHLAELGLRPSTKRTQPLADANILYKTGGKENEPTE
ncbi:Required for respiratory growth protein 9, mitochondrial [Aspergillus alliaceus]|uniref:Required for respiratory growth protein 9, mitochondrial n=1 Tax=Petromyces alliaceus TaxID=209559 RepID=A0A5N7CIA1_PETAA|nr:Required for respiratory growth protein 9, mitochondrial [Aspergillus alliaceus]